MRRSLYLRAAFPYAEACTANPPAASMININQADITFIIEGPRSTNL
ncbi:hypothetical protein [Sneathiella aquimaris]|nr:hypothetical protein [Sneathiella aquimaris]